MFSDTHFHFRMTAQENPECGAGLLESYASSKPLFALDIGTRCDDLLPRIGFAKKSLSLMSPDKRATAERFLFFSAGIWPDVEEIKKREECIRTLENQIDGVMRDENLKDTLVAIGECGLDHHWNPSNPDARNESDFSSTVYEGERELFLMQLDMAKKKDLPVVVHSRDAFDGTVFCLDESGWNRGVIHCYSYGIDEAKQFLDRGWYIAFGGATTYTKKNRMEDMKKLLNYVPLDRMLLETDSPYLAPVPVRGKPNTPLNIHYSYEFIASNLGVEVDKLCASVDENIGRLFRL